MSTVAPEVRSIGTPATEAGRADQLEDGLLVVSENVDSPIVVSNSQEALPEPTAIVQRDSSLYPVFSQEPLVELGPVSEKPTTIAETKERRNLRFKKRKLAATALVALIIIGAVVGGVVGGTRRSRKTAAPPTPTPTPRMSFKMQTWGNPSYQGRSQLIYSPGGFATSFLVRSYHWEPGAYAGRLRCSMAICFNDNGNGWWGVSERYWPGRTDNSSLGAVFVNIVCKDEFEDPGCPGPGSATTYTTVPVLETTSIDPTKTIPAPTDLTTESPSSSQKSPTQT